MAEFDLTDGTNSRIESSLTGAEGKFSAPVSRLERIINGEDIKPLSRIEEVMKNYSPQPGPGESSIVVIEGTKNSEGTTVTLNKSFSEIKALIEEGKMPIIAVTGLPYAGENYYVLYNKYDGSTVNKQVNFIFSGTDCKYNSETNVLEIKNIRLGLDETENNVARVINNNIDVDHIGYKELSGTLTAGETSLTLTDSSITTNSLYDIYTSVYGVNPTDVTVTTGSITLTFAVQQSDLGVKVRVS